MGTKEVEFNQKLNSQISENISLNKEYRLSGMSSLRVERPEHSSVIRNIVVKWDTVTGGLAPLVELLTADRRARSSFTLKMILTIKQIYSPRWLYLP